MESKGRILGLLLLLGLSSAFGHEKHEHGHDVAMMPYSSLDEAESALSALEGQAQAGGYMCHGDAHEIGHRLAATLLEENKSGLEAARVVGEICGTRCQFGCFHGAVGSLIVSGGVQTATDLCLQGGYYNKQLDAGECSHAAGHAFLKLRFHGSTATGGFDPMSLSAPTQQGVDPHGAENMCVQAFANAPIGLTYYCQAGAWMELFTEHWGEVTSRFSTPLEWCEQAQTKNKGFCRYYALREYPVKDVDEAIADCDDVSSAAAGRGEGGGPSAYESCVFATALHIGWWAEVEERQELARACGDLRWQHSGAAAIACVDGLAARMRKYFSDERMAVCGSLPEESVSGRDLVVSLRQRCMHKGQQVYYDLQRDVFW
uniref:Uncharacterized protein n=1 Tax=Chromera velia CCMP2878 TaxID=1169474 RepID=A0A0G4H9V8_9ALVE|mmetsp:Transcript_23234/g.45705  ORF Transcript_23234/g.45705 Transcript_23234/m.45705 type:complete len:374 (-) Transcript_23234:472-1593(-)|eukprot:Cvel_25496.t1-p1 / transcript=Cvel_25496.t1 / gene=Cvel_25496 / organism=Chromera_velia_CCMP2878 / gene_product=hypothetical protein / transcript_product=hypothetical protein / location=Cvel_scaffold2897:13649-16073(-) / protein_length=373 / sequence_SO=supercontig / SO=protein_coding / is_pseudo=false